MNAFVVPTDQDWFACLLGPTFIRTRRSARGAIVGPVAFIVCGVALSPP